MKKIIFFLLLLCTVNGFSQEYLGEGPFDQLIIRGVMLINGDGSPPRGPIDIVVENNKIVKIQVVGYPNVKIDDSKRPKLKRGGKELDASGMYLLPGFVDMHGHIGGPAQGASPEYVFKLWMAHGITTVRQPSGINAKELKKKTADTFFTIGFLNGFLPCGLVYMAVFAAIATGNALQGSLYMVLFGLGTVPLMTSVIYFSRFLKGRFRNKIQKAIPVFVVLIGLLFIIRGLGLGIPYLSPAPMTEMASSTMECVNP